MNAVGLEANSFFQSLNMPNLWICDDFKNMSIKPSHRTIRSSYEGMPGVGWLKVPAMETVDRRVDNHELARRNATCRLRFRDLKKCR
jgi:hypothetical protein